MSENRLSITFFLAASFLYWITLYLYIPTLPTYIKTKAINFSMIGLVLSMYGLWQLITRIPIGITVDSIGWGKPLIMIGLGFAASGAFIMGKGNTLRMIALGRALTGVAAAAWVPLLVVFSTFFTAEKAIYASSMLAFTMSFGRMIATALTGILNRVGGYTLPFFIASICGVLAIGTIAFVREKRRPPERISLEKITALFLRKDVVLPGVINVIVHYADWAITFGFLPILAQNLGANDVMKSIILSLNLASIAVANLVSTLMLKKIKHEILLCSGAFLFFSGIMVISFAISIPWLFAGTILMGFAFGVVYPILLGMSIQKVDRNQRNTAMGIHQSLYSIGMWTGPWLSGIMADLTGIKNTFILTGGFYLISVYFFIYLLLRGRK